MTDHLRAVAPGTRPLWTRHGGAQGLWVPWCWLWGLVVAYVLTKGILRGARFD